MLAATFGTGQVFLEILWFFLFIIWLYLLILVFADIFRSPDMGGIAKAIWVLLVIVLPYLGVFLYLIVRGGSMHERALQARAAQDAATRQYIRDAMKDTPT